MSAERIRRAAATAVAVVIALVALVPVLVVLVGGVVTADTIGVASEQWIQGDIGGLVTTKWIRYVVTTYAPMLRFSAEVAGLTAVACLVVGVPGAYALVRRPTRGSRVLEELALAPLALPGLALSVALIQTYSAARGSPLLIVAGHLIYTLPLMLRTVTAALRGADVGRLETAAASLGASLGQRLRLVVVPAARHAVVTGTLLVLAVSWGEFNVSYLLNTPVHQTFPAALYATYTFNSFQVSSAATLVFLGVLVPLLVVLQWRSDRAETVQGV